MFKFFERCKIKNAQLNLFPYPYIDVENYFSENEINEINLHWPDLNKFDQAGNSGLHTFQLSFETLKGIHSVSSSFWLELLEDKLYPILYKTLSKFADYHVYRMGDLKNLYLGGAMLMEINTDMIENYEMNVHTHFFHDPFWLNTTLVSISPEVTNGTTLYKTENYNKLSDLNKFYEDVEKIGNLSLKKNYDRYLNNYEIFHDIIFKPGKVFSFMDSPISIHGVKSYNTKQKASSRRVIRFHTGSFPTGKYGEIEKIRKKIKTDLKFRKNFFIREIETLINYYASTKHPFKYVNIKENYDLKYLRIVGH